MTSSTYFLETRDDHQSIFLESHDQPLWIVLWFEPANSGDSKNLNPHLLHQFTVKTQYN
jgi:hypothetical protein